MLENNSIHKYQKKQTEILFPRLIPHSQGISETDSSCPFFARARCLGLDFPTSVSSFRARRLAFSVSCPGLCPLGLPRRLAFCALLPLPPKIPEPVVLHSPHQPPMCPFYILPNSGSTILGKDALVPWRPTGQWQRCKVPEKPSAGLRNLRSPPIITFLTTLFVGVF